MTFVGKILVVAIMFFACAFLVLSSVVFNTTTNWKEKTEAQQKQITDLTSKAAAAKQLADGKDQDIQKLKAANLQDLKKLEDRIVDLDKENNARQKEITENRKLLEEAQTNARNALAEANQRVVEADQLRDILRDVQKQANAYKDRERGLNDQIRLLRRDLDVAVANNKRLREEVAAYAYVLHQNNLDTDITRFIGRKAPPDVQGEVRRVDMKARRVEISLGSDEGFAVGDVLLVYRTKPTAEYLGKIQLISVESDQAVGTIVGQTVNGKQIHEGDHVATKIRPRG